MQKDIDPNFIPDSELIINPDGSIYHLNLRPEQLAETIITVGDPDRVSKVTKHFDRIDEKVQKREFVTHTGELNGKRISVISTGIGTDNIDIVFNELDALVNIDFSTRRIKENLTSLDIVRVGTSGCMQEDIPVDTFLFSAFGIGLDGLIPYYDYKENEAESQLNEAFHNTLSAQLNLPLPVYFAQGSERLLQQIGHGFLHGMTVTCPGFYAPQGRQLRAKVPNQTFLNTLSSFSHNGTAITNFEMETAGIYGMSRLLGHYALSCNALLANRKTNVFSKDPGKITNELIALVLDRLTSNDA